MASQAIFDQEKNNRNRTTFASEMGVRASGGQRQGMFSSALPLTVGDKSSYYDVARKPAEEVGKVRAFSNNRGMKTTAECFGKFTSNAIGDEY